MTKYEAFSRAFPLPRLARRIRVWGCLATLFVADLALGKTPLKSMFSEGFVRGLAENGAKISRFARKVANDPNSFATIDLGGQITTRNPGRKVDEAVWTELSKWISQGQETKLELQKAYLHPLGQEQIPENNKLTVAYNPHGTELSEWQNVGPDNLLLLGSNVGRRPLPSKNGSSGRGLTALFNDKHPLFGYLNRWNEYGSTEELVERMRKRWKLATSGNGKGASAVAVVPIRPDQVKPVAGKFGRTFGPYMMVQSFSAETGKWSRPKVSPLAKRRWFPMIKGLQYGETMFEGLKVYRGVDGRVRLWRPFDHIQRMRTGALKWGMEPIEAISFLKGIIAMVEATLKTNPEAIPAGGFLYLRPLLVATDPFLEPRASGSFDLVVVASPAKGNSEDRPPLHYLVNTQHARATPGLTGDVKTGFNYGLSIIPAQEAYGSGHDGVLFTDSVKHKNVEEAGAMNVLFVIGDKIVTPRLTGTILDGVTRRSVLKILQDRGYRVEERDISPDEVAAAGRDGSLQEIIGTGTLASLESIGRLTLGKKVIATEHANSHGPVVKLLRKAMLDRQTGMVEDPDGWTLDLTAYARP